MGRTTKLVVAWLLLVGFIGCGGETVRIDCSEEGKFNSSLTAAMEQLSATDKETMTELMAKRMETAIQGEFSSGLAAAFRGEKHEVGLVPHKIFSDLNGMTAKEAMASLALESVLPKSTPKAPKEPTALTPEADELVAQTEFERIRVECEKAGVTPYGLTQILSTFYEKKNKEGYGIAAKWFRQQVEGKKVSDFQRPSAEQAPRQESTSVNAKETQPIRRANDEPLATSEDSRSRWLNTSYNSTIYRVQGKQWAEMENATQKVKWTLEERDRTPEYIELFNTTRKDTTRLFDKRMDVKEGDTWKWVSNGHWDRATGNPATITQPQ